MKTQTFQFDLHATSYGIGSLAYIWVDDTSRRFPEDVEAVYIVLPHASQQGTEWLTCRWKLTGTYDKPTLYPSLNWLGKCHGWLRDGKLIECQ